MNRTPVYIITGASTGIGAACAHQLAQQGANVVLLARRLDVLEHTQATLAHATRHLSVACDVTDEQQVHAAVARAMEHYGAIDGVICNAGIGLTGPVATLSYADIQRCMDVNVAGTLYAIQACLPIFRQQHAGHIVVVSSVVGVQGLPFNGGYCASKGALERLCDALRIELFGSAIALTVVRPGTVQSDFFRSRIGESGERRRRASTGITPADVATVVARCLRTRPRIAYTRWQDRVALWTAQRFPWMSDWVLARSIEWQTNPPHDHAS